MYIVFSVTYEFNCGLNDYKQLYSRECLASFFRLRVPVVCIACFVMTLRAVNTVIHHALVQLLS